ncbi:unnamed protein product [Durusdinium trenchii]
MNRQRKEKANKAARKREMFNKEMDKPYTEQQALDEMTAHNIPHDWSSLRGSSEFQDGQLQTTGEFYASNASEASSSSLSSVGSSVAVVHEQVARMVNHRRSNSPGPEECKAPERRAWQMTRPEEKPQGYSDRPRPEQPSPKAQRVQSVRVQL